MKQLLRTLGVTVALVLVIPMFALPAEATPAVGTAELTSGFSALSGDTNNEFGILVRNTGGLQGASINTVEVLVPITGFTIVDASGPAGWNTTWNVSTGRIFFDGSSIPSNPIGAASAQFTIHANVFRQPADTARTWDVLLSSDAGDTYNHATAPAGKTLTTAISVLKVISVAITAPTLAADGDVTEGQSVTVQEVVQNAGSQALTVTPSLSSPNITPNPATAPPAQNIGSASQTTFTFTNVTFGSAPVKRTDRATLVGGATAPGANAISNATGPINIMIHATFGYVPNSIQPRDLTNGSYAFSLTVSKNGEVTVPSLAGTTLKIGPNGEFSAPLDQSQAPTIGPGNNNYSLKFVSTAVPVGLADGNYFPSVPILGTDQNGFAVNQTVGVTDRINLDRLAPTVTPTLTPPKSKVVGAADAAHDGQPNALGGTIVDGGNSCGLCTVTNAFVRELNASGGTVRDDPATVTNSGGAMSGTFTQATFDQATTAIELWVTAVDPSGNSTTSRSTPPVPVDNIAPQVANARTGGTTSDPTRIDVYFTELVGTNAMSPSDWNVPGHTVTSAQPAPGQTSAGFDHVVLTVAGPLTGNETPTVQYAPSVATRAFDRVGLSVVDKAVTASDGIVPALPTISQVSGHDRQADGFYTNDTNPKFKIGSVANGETSRVYRDNNTDGVINTGDTLLGQATASDGSGFVVVTSTGLGTINQVFQFLVQTTDSAGNAGATASDSIHLDFIVPTVLSASAAGSTITVNFSEGLAYGRNSASDWYASGSTNGVGYNFGVGSVSGTGPSRAANIDSNNFIAGTSVLSSVSYDLQNQDKRYQDAAGNPLSNFTKAIT